MELEVVGHRNMPESAIVSVRVGSTRRQEQLARLDKAFKFPSAPDVNTTFKVDVLDLIGGARLHYNPNETDYNFLLDAPIDGGTSTGMEITLRVSNACGKDANAVGAGAGEDARAMDEKREVAARDYLERHGLTAFMQFLMQSLMKDKPADPYSFLHKQVTNKMISEVSRNVAGDSVNLDYGLDALLAKFASDSSQEVTAEQLAELEREAAAAGEQLRTDNERLRETTEQLKSRYGQLLEESVVLQIQASVEGGAAGGQAPPPVDQSESAQVTTYREIYQMQEDVTNLARENAALVEQLASMRATIDAVQGDMEGLPPNE